MALIKILDITQGRQKTKKGRQLCAFCQNLVPNTVSRHLYASERIPFNKVFISSEKNF